MIWKFNPLEKHTIWGGGRLSTLFPSLAKSAVDCPGSGPVGEVWVLSGVPGSETCVAEGSDKGLALSKIVAEYGARLLGKKNSEKFGNAFPLLIKFIDAADDLSVQVHPDDKMAQSHGKPFGKSEMWYVVDALPGARLAAGLNTPVDPAQFAELTASGEIVDRMRYSDVTKGEVYMIPAGRVHALGKGCLVLEIQETSDETYRLYDYHRKDANGNERELHTELAREAMDFNDTKGFPTDYDHNAEDALLIDSPHFTTRRLTPTGPVVKDYSCLDSFVVIIASAGSAVVSAGGEETVIEAGQCALLSADIDKAEIIPSEGFDALETYIG